jgi:hypothetical protein
MRDRTAAAALGVAVLLPVAVMPDLVWGGLGQMRTTDYRRTGAGPPEVPGDATSSSVVAFRTPSPEPRTTSLTRRQEFPRARPSVDGCRSSPVDRLVG